MQSSEDEVIGYWAAYYLNYRFGGAHRKHDPSDQAGHPLRRILRWIEERDYPQLTCKQPAKLALPTVDAADLNPELFQSLSRNKTHPVVIRGLLRDSSAVRSWSADYFKQNYGESSAPTLRKPPGKQGGAYTSFNEALDVEDLALEESVRGMQEGEVLYVNNVTRIFHDHPELVTDLELWRLHLAEPRINPRTWLKINLFMGGPGTGSSLHCAVAGNFFFNVHGRKKWVLIDPRYSKYLRSTPSKNFEFVISGLDVENPSDVLKKIPKYEVILEPGDVVFNAPWWWHYVKNETEFTIGCAVRDHTCYRQSFQNNPMFMCMSPYPINLNPWILKLAARIKGRAYMLGRSAKSEDAIVENLTGRR